MISALSIRCRSRSRGRGPGTGYSVCDARGQRQDPRLPGSRGPPSSAISTLASAAGCRSVPTSASHHVVRGRAVAWRGERSGVNAEVPELNAEDFEALGVYNPDAPRAAERVELLRYLVSLGVTADVVGRGRRRRFKAEPASTDHPTRPGHAAARCRFRMP
jgi:hypothetical protein